ncbi:MAG: thioredoxin domain-containing protein [Deltaproteobacteria bacterium]|nr:thioredoxin domain-containing protein [Deltaproteobacteria bacterium]
MKIIDLLKKHRNKITIILALAGIILMFYYDYCDTACSYLKGDIWGIDLKWVGIIYMAAIIAFAAFRQAPFVRALLAAGLGVEVYLYAFQVQNDVYCPFCIAFSIMLILSFLINYEVPSAWLEDRRRMWLYFLGEVDFPMFSIHKLPLLIFSLLGYLTILFTFSGSVTPAYGQDTVCGLPSLGKGAYEVVIFTDYFCPPCRRIDIKAEPLLKELLATDKVRITFIDVPFHSATSIYAKYYLYATNADPAAENVLHVRKLLFDAAQIKNIKTEDALVIYLSEQKILWKALNEKSIFPIMITMIKESKVESTPTCVIKYSPGNIKKYVGDDKIWDGLNQLKARLYEKK